MVVVPKADAPGCVGVLPKDELGPNAEVEVELENKLEVLDVLGVEEGVPNELEPNTEVVGAVPNTEVLPKLEVEGCEVEVPKAEVVELGGCEEFVPNVEVVGVELLPKLPNEEEPNDEEPKLSGAWELLGAEVEAVVEEPKVPKGFFASA